MKLPTITNGVLTQVNGAGLDAEGDRPPVLGSVKWTGAERINIVHETEEQTRASRGDLGLPVMDVLVERSVVVDSRIESKFIGGVKFEEGDKVTFTRDGETEEVGTVQWRRATTGLGLGGVIRLRLDRA